MEISFSRLCFTTQFVPEVEVLFSRLCFTTQFPGCASLSNGSIIFVSVGLFA